MASPVLQRSLSSLKLQYSSPLDSLVRRTSSRETSDPGSSSLQPAPAPKSQSRSQSPHDSQVTPSRPQRPPSSPLLHTQFRNSTATGSTTLDNSSYYYRKSEVSFAEQFQEVEYYRHGDDDSVYSSQEASSTPLSPLAPRQWYPKDRAPDHSHPGSDYQQPWTSSYSSDQARLDVQSAYSSGPYDELPDEMAYRGDAPQPSPPIVIISDHDTPTAQNTPRGGKAPVLVTAPINFSRPARPSMITSEQKRQVLERNSRHDPSSQPPSPSARNPDMSGEHPSTRSPSERTLQRSSSPSSTANRSPSPSYPAAYSLQSGSQAPLVSSISPSQSSQSLLSSYAPPYPPQRSSQVSPSVSSVFGQTSSRSRPPSPIPDHIHNSYLQPSPIASTATFSPQVPLATAGNPVLPRHPPSLRVSSAESIYSAYSYYDLDSPKQVFTGSDRLSPNDHPDSWGSQRENRQQLSSATSPIATARRTPPVQTPQDYLQLGIQHHEANRLQDSAACFEKSAKEGGGCGVGMLMYGLTLRHGWGCDKNEKSGFKWLRKAAELATEDLEGAREKMEANAVQTELLLAIYEVAQCFFQGWGVPKDQKMAVSYYTVAARLGDIDAQQDLAFCLANGKGCKKDRKEAAKWYRAAVAQGASDVGLAWIYKEKFA